MLKIPLILIITIYVVGCASNATNSDWRLEYAKNSVEQNEFNNSKQCRLMGPHWHSDVSKHKTWADGASQDQANTAFDRRQSKLDHCKFAMQYAQDATAQQLRNIELKCGYEDPSWHDNTKGHFNWARQQSGAELNTHMERRANQLAECVRQK